MRNDSCTAGDGRRGATCGPSVAAGVQELKDDALTLVRLQGELMKDDLVHWGKTISGGVYAACAALLLATGAVPVVLLGLGWLLAERTELSLGGGLLVVGAGALAIAALVALGAYRAVQNAGPIFVRSQDEFRQNLGWAKEAFRRDWMGRGATVEVPPNRPR